MELQACSNFNPPGVDDFILPVVIVIEGENFRKEPVSVFNGSYSHPFSEMPGAVVDGQIGHYVCVSC